MVFLKRIYSLLLFVIEMKNWQSSSMVEMAILQPVEIKHQ